MRRRLLAAIAAGLVFSVAALTSDRLPTFSFHADLVASMAVMMGALAVVIWALLPLHRRPPLLWALVVGGLAAAILGHTLIDSILLADAGKVALGSGLGFLLGAKLAELTEDVRWVVGVALVVAVVDAFSVFSPVGVTNMILTKAPDTVPYFVVAFPVSGYSMEAGDYSALGTADVIFFALYLVSAAVFGLRVRATAAAMVVAVAVSVAIASWWRAIPALPLLGLAFIAANADLLWGSPRPRYVGADERPAAIDERPAAVDESAADA